ncbi:MAG: hypothetical protein K9K79_02660 [Desulfohalobiaceae bacterium]|nr:hypothetical protein [Desulfohalobiaceae bacterium]
MEIFEDMQVDFSLSEVRKKIRLEDPDRLQEIMGNRMQNLIDKVLPGILPRAVYRAGFLDSKEDAGVVVDGIGFQSTFLRKTLEDVGRVFPFVITIGTQLEEEITQADDLIDRFLLEKIGDLALDQARLQLQDYLKKRYGFNRLSSMCPGGYGDWPVQERKKIFSVIGDVQQNLGVRLHENFRLDPQKSISGLYFPTEVSILSCQLCPRQACLYRKAAYNGKKTKEHQDLVRNPIQTLIKETKQNKKFREVELLLLWA